MPRALINSVSILCCLLRSSPACSFACSPWVTAYPRPRTPIEICSAANSATGQNPMVEATHSRRGKGRRAAAQQARTTCCGCWRRGQQQQQQGDIRRQRHSTTWNLQRRRWPLRSEGPLGSSWQEDFVSGEIESREEFEAWRAAAAEAGRASGDGSSSPGDAAVSAAAVPVEQVYSARASPPGVDWVSLFQAGLDQLLFFGFFAWLATPATRVQVRSLFMITASGVALGALAAAPMFVYGLCLGTRHWPWLETPRAKSSRGAKQPNFFGRNRQVAKVAAVSIPLAVLVGFCEECVYRGFFPLLLAAKTGLPLAAIVGLSAIFCGARHAGTLGSGIDAAVLGVYVHCLLLSTGSILVPIVAHAVFDAVLFVAEHVNETRQQQQA